MHRALLRHPGLSMAGAGPGSAAAFGVPPNHPSSLTSGRTASSCRKPGCRSPGKVGEKATDRDMRGRVQRENPTKCKKNRLGRQEPRCRVKCVCPGLGERRRSVPGSGGHGWAPAPLPARGASRPSPRVCHRFGSLGPSRGQEKPTFWSQSTVPRVREERSRGEAGGVAALRAAGRTISPGQPGRERWPGPGKCFGQTCGGGWGWER